jgi:hypothetical protein
VLGFVQQDDRPLDVVLRQVEEPGVDGDDLEREVGGGVGLVVLVVEVPPVVGGAEARHVPQREHFLREALLLEEIDGGDRR